MLSTELGPGFDTCGLKPLHREECQAGPAEVLTPLSARPNDLGSYFGCILGKHSALPSVSHSSATVVRGRKVLDYEFLKNH